MRAVIILCFYLLLETEGSNNLVNVRQKRTLDLVLRGVADVFGYDVLKRPPVIPPAPVRTSTFFPPPLRPLPPAPKFIDQLTTKKPATPPKPVPAQKKTPAPKPAQPPPPQPKPRPLLTERKTLNISFNFNKNLQTQPTPVVSTKPVQITTTVKPLPPSPPPNKKPPSPPPNKKPLQKSGKIDQYPNHPDYDEDVNENYDKQQFKDEHDFNSSNPPRNKISHPAKPSGNIDQYPIYPDYGNHELDENNQQQQFNNLYDYNNNYDETPEKNNYEASKNRYKEESNNFWQNSPFNNQAGYKYLTNTPTEENFGYGDQPRNQYTNYEAFYNDKPAINFQNKYEEYQLELDNNENKEDVIVNESKNNPKKDSSMSKKKIMKPPRKSKKIHITNKVKNVEPLLSGFVPAPLHALQERRKDNPWPAPFDSEESSSKQRKVIHKNEFAYVPEHYKIDAPYEVPEPTTLNYKEFEKLSSYDDLDKGLSKKANVVTNEYGKKISLIKINKDSVKLY